MPLNSAKIRSVLLVTACLYVSPSVGRAGVVTEFESDAAGWLAIVEASTGFEKHAFDSFYPGLRGAAGVCVAPSPTVILKLRHGEMSVISLDLRNRCPLFDGTGGPWASDGQLHAAPAPRLRMEFDPPISAFYTYYGSVQSGSTTRMELYYQDVLVETIERNNQQGPFGFSIGHGFISSEPIDRLEFTSLGDLETVGAFIDLVEGESSLGTVIIPGYQGPSADTVLLDFGLVFSETVRVKDESPRLLSASIEFSEDIRGLRSASIEFSEDIRGLRSASVEFNVEQFLVDVNDDGVFNGLDVQCFANCILGIELSPCNCKTADYDEDSDVDGDDLETFIDLLLNGLGGP